MANQYIYQSDGCIVFKAGTDGITNPSPKATLRFLESMPEGCYISNDENQRKVEITNMRGGRYLFYDNIFVAGQSNSVLEAIKFLELFS